MTGSNSPSREVRSDASHRFRAILAALPRWVLGLIVAVALLGVIVVAWRLNRFLSDFNDAVEILSDHAGLNRWLAKAIAIALASPVVWGIRRSFGTSSSVGRTRFGTLAYACAYFLTMFLLTRNVSFDHTTRKVVQWYADTPEGTRFFDSPGVDPVYGIELKPVTPEIKIAIEQQRRGLIPKLVPLAHLQEIDLFDPVTGANRFWYDQLNEQIYLVYDKSGYSSASGRKLRAVTQSVAAIILQTRARHEAQAQRSDSVSRVRRADSIATARQLDSLSEQRIRQSNEARRQADSTRLEVAAIAAREQAEAARQAEIDAIRSAANTASSVSQWRPDLRWVDIVRGKTILLRSSSLSTELAGQLLYRLELLEAHVTVDPQPGMSGLTPSAKIEYSMEADNLATTVRAASSGFLRLQLNSHSATVPFTIWLP